MKRRSFVKKSSFAAAVIATPVLLTGISKADEYGPYASTWCTEAGTLIHTNPCFTEQNGTKWYGCYRLQGGVEVQIDGCCQKWVDPNDPNHVEAISGQYQCPQ